MSLAIAMADAIAGGVQAPSPFLVHSQTMLGYWDLSVQSSVTIATGISQLNDLSSGGHNLTQGTGGNQFPYTAPAAGANGYLTGVGGSGNHQLTNASFPVLASGTTSNTIYLLGRFASPAAAQNAWVDFGATTLHNCIYRSSTATQLFMYAGTNVAVAGGIAVNADAFVQCEFAGTASSRIGFDNVFTSGNAGNTASTGGISLGNFYQAANECTGRIYAVVIFGGILSAGDQLTMKQWGNARLGLSM